MRELGPAQIHLWQYPIGEIPANLHLARAVTLLDTLSEGDERRRYAAFHFEKHRAEYALSHAMLRLALSEYASVEPEDWRFVAGPWGKPEIGGPALDAPLWFNLSHTDGFAVCVVGRTPELGVDVENLKRKASVLELAQRFFAPSEYEYLRHLQQSLPQSLQRDAFFRIWTLKEAYIKATGKGLSIPLDSFQFRISAENPGLSFESHAGSGQDWSFFEFQPELDYRVAVAAKRLSLETFQVSCLDAAMLFA